MGETWQEIAARKRKAQKEQIPKQWLLPSIYTDGERLNVINVPDECGILTTDDLRITDTYDATTLVSHLADGKLRSTDVVTSFCKRAAIAHQLTNCLTEILFDDAIRRAKYLDDQLKQTGKPVGPLHGLPISLKDSFKVKGYDTSIGVAAFCFKPADKNSALVDLLLKAGAVLYCKTNVPQTLMALDSHNNVFGRTLNPANRHLTAGGSTGGEGALLAMHGSVLGIGTDVGGSIRIPAMCNGLVGVKPSHGRVPYAGQESGTLPGSSKLGVESTAGPLARNVKDCKLLLKTVGDCAPWLFDPDVMPQTWEQQTPLTSTMPPSSQQSKRSICRIGIARTDGHVEPLPPIKRLLDEVSRLLLSSGRSTGYDIEVVEVDISALGPHCLKTFNGVMSIDGANTWFDHLEATGEPLSPWLQSRLRRRPRKSLEEVRLLQAQKTELQTKFSDVWRESGGYWSIPDSKAGKGDRTLDVIICPAAPHPIAPVDRWNTTNYTSALNLLDCPAGVLPVRKFREADLEGELPTSSPLNGWDKINRELWTAVDRRVYMDSMMSVQIIVPKLMERTLVDAMATLENIFLKMKQQPLGSSKL